MPPPRKSHRTQRITLEPIGRFAFLVVGVHLLIGGGLWWWLSRTQGAGGDSAEAQKLTWVSPADFTSAPTTPEAKPEALSPPPTTPQPPVVPTPPEPAPVAVPSSPIAVAPTPQPAPAPPASKLAENTHEVPKAIALDPAQAMAIMAKARAAETATTPAPSAPIPKPPPAAMAAPEPDVSAPPPPPQAVETSRFVTVSLKPAAPAPKTPPKVASLLDMATLDAQGTGGQAGVRLIEVDRAIISAFMREWVPPDASLLKQDQRTAHLDMSINRAGHVLTFKLTQPSGSIDLDMSVLEAADRLDKIEAQLPASYPKDRYDFQVNLHAE